MMPSLFRSRRRGSTVRLLAAVIGGLTLAGPLAAQDLAESEPIPPELAADVVAWFNDPGVVRLEGRAVIPAGTSLDAPVALLRGELVVNGVIRGDVVLLDGDLSLGADGRIEGDVLIVGGRLRAGEASAIDGLLTEFPETFRWETEGGVLVVTEASLRQERGIRLFGSRISIRAGTNYNRIEGLPVHFGPVIESSGENPIRLEGLVTWRTEQSFTDDELGFRILLERRIGRPARFFYGASAYSEVTPIERWGLGDLEASLATFLLHRDYRDYFERHGWSAFVGAAASRLPIRAQIGYRDEKHFALPVGSPWSLSRNAGPWRPLPLVGEGDVRLIEFEVRVDDRNSADDPTDGWYLNARLRYGLTGDLTLPPFAEDSFSIAANPTTDLPTEFSSGFLDLRRYARVDPTSHLALRLVLAGSINGRRLPTQFQHALGGEGSLPGWKPFELDCGARSTPVFVERENGRIEPSFRAYGCDRIALFQAEYRRTLTSPIRIGSGGSDWLPRMELEPTIVGFFDAGRAWSDVVDGEDLDDHADVGMGLEIGSLGAYFAYPLGGDHRFNFFVRLQRRF